MAIAPRKSKTLKSYSSKAFLLHDIVVLEQSSERLLPIEDAPRGRCEFNTEIFIIPSVRGEQSGALLRITVTATGYLTQGKNSPKVADDTKKKSFTAKIKLEAFFAAKNKSLKFKNGDHFQKADVHSFAIQLIPVVLLKISEMISSMGYRNVQLPFDLLEEDMQLTSDKKAQAA